MHAIELERDEGYPQAPEGFDNIASAADAAMAEVFYIDALRYDDERDVKAINRLCAA